MAERVKAESRHVPVCAAGLAVAYLLAATLAPVLLAPLVVAAAVAACALALLRHRSRAVAVSTAAIGVWLALGFTGAWLLRDDPAGGLLWAVLGLFVLPLPVIPWLYASTFPTVPGPRSPVPPPGGRAE